MNAERIAELTALAEKRWWAPGDVDHMRNALPELLAELEECRLVIKGVCDAAKKAHWGVQDNQEYDPEQRGRDMVEIPLAHATDASLARADKAEFQRDVLSKMIVPFLLYKRLIFKEECRECQASTENCTACLQEELAKKAVLELGRVSLAKSRGEVS